MSPIADHPLRYQLVNELHARPFPVLKGPCRAAYLAIKPATDAAARDRELDRKHLAALLDHYAAPHPEPGATHYFGPIGKHFIKWESHTEFVTYTIFGDGVADRPFDAHTFSMFPEDWLRDAPGVRITSALIRVELSETADDIPAKVDDWFVPESLAVSRVLDDSAVVAGDFRLDAAGHIRFAVFARPDTGSRRIGRIVQRLCEIETYKTLSMLGWTRSRELGPRMGAIDQQLSHLMGDMTGDTARPEATLKALLGVSSELENILAQTAFRFGATGAYEALVNQRIAILREQRYDGRQTFAEFMTRRFDPAMRTVKSTEARLKTMSDRALRAGDLLRTRVDVERSAQNQTLLESMDKRADLQLRLQRTVEGLSVVAISYYAVNLVTYMVYPLVEPTGLSKGMATALLTPLVILGVWFMVRRVRKSLH
ncbi:DUF3422 family protein [Alphaproteobacteria bacterium GH1-50]|uniref:DUF3422 family protein n=1 Tax=Kangsaoukella pontilimi TaxID=2691042 RepID=A0A7C9IID8_9RHOB|nr:DUF3422 domain-containing protein [Kangsaoukella pontilimi]MXQ09207.1 DUF3422 family protein [Kangsaoukella pontilimi]